ncbi:MAG: UDP-N-acetylmuramoyl-tripeptide--D-alanyl-D-alanine ligase [Chlorobi bacterium]|nr:UDP-N-acetylmuramoyl-tripeptide--D-alanyl-D-alanine ligase [Chlorobiota bacterium]
MLERLYRIFTESEGVEKDTRRPLEGKIYWALKGERFDGNAFIDQALEKGAVHAVSDDPRRKGDPRITVVDNTLHALWDLARLHRRRTGVKVIAVTGSNGKTTTKELMREVLSRRFHVIATEGNLNNHIGVPLTLLSIRPDTEIAVVEMGINHFGEMELLCRIAEPDYGYITSFGEAHLEFFGNLEGVIRAKTVLYRYLRVRDGLAFINRDDPVQRTHTRGMRRYGFTYAHTPGADVILEKAAETPFLAVRYKGLEIPTRLAGAFHFTNIGGAITAGDYFGVSPRLIAEAVSSYQPRNNRSQWIETSGGLRILLDAYNANPTSMKAALETLARMPGKKAAVLGDMLELGPSAPEKHAEIVRLLKELDIPAWLIGPVFSSVPHHEGILGTFPSADAFKNAVNLSDLGDATVLIKASRGLTLERVVEDLLREN